MEGFFKTSRQRFFNFSQWLPRVLSLFVFMRLSRINRSIGCYNPTDGSKSSGVKKEFLFLETVFKLDAKMRMVSAMYLH